MLIGAGIAAVGFAATALAVNVLDLLRLALAVRARLRDGVRRRAGLRARRTRPRQPGAGFALFVGAIMVATVCGPSIGGILADNIGERPTFAVAALLALGSIAAIAAAARAAAAQRSAARARAGAAPARDRRRCSLNQRFMTLTGLAAMPAKILLTGVCFYLVPLYVVSIGSTQADGRAHADGLRGDDGADRAARGGARRRRASACEWLVGGGPHGLGPGRPAAAGRRRASAGSSRAVFLLGLGQSLSIAAQSALVREHCEEEIARHGRGRGVRRLPPARAPGQRARARCSPPSLVMLRLPRAASSRSARLVLLCGIALRDGHAPRPRPALAAA